MMTPEKFTQQTYRILKATYGVIPIVAGLDKFTNLLVDWSKYLSPIARNFLPISPHAFMLAVGVIEIAAGVLVLSKATKLGAWIVTLWLIAIAVNLVTAGFFDIAVRDLVMSVGAFRLVRAAEALAPAREAEKEKFAHARTATA